MSEPCARSRITTAADFERALIDFVNVRMPELHQMKFTPDVNAFTPLFESGLIDSLGILHLIAFVEQATGKSIPTKKVVMKHFRTVEAIRKAFWEESTC
jgi:acyl carrier protein